MKIHEYINYMHNEGVTSDVTNDKITISSSSSSGSIVYSTTKPTTNIIQDMAWIS